MRGKKIIIYYIAVVVFITLTLTPFLWALIVSLTPEFEMFNSSKNFLPSEFIFDNYETLLSFESRESKVFFRGIINSIKTSFITILFCLPSALLGAYAISRIKFKGKKLIKNILLSTMAIPVFTTIIPIYRMFASLNLLDNVFSLSLVYVTSFLPVITWILSNYFDSIPKEIEEAAFIDGCNKVSVFCRIILPLSYPAIFSSFLMIFLMTWAQFQVPLILASSMSTKPISIIVSEFVSKDTIKYGITTAAGLLAVVPPIILALIFNKFIISGMTGNSGK